jgi:hypothetical protein
MFRVRRKRSPRLLLRRAGPGPAGDSGRQLLVGEGRGAGGTAGQEEEAVTLDCVNGWLLSIFVKVFD